jgi:hypothetical protein
LTLIKVSELGDVDSTVDSTVSNVRFPW